MVVLSSLNFDPFWNDNVFDLSVIDIPLIFPDDTPRNNESGIWVQSKFELVESAFGQEIQHNLRRCVKYLLKKSDLINYYTLQDSSGNTSPKDSMVYDVIFPPQAWMTDSLQERCMVYVAAQRARGKILVGGLGLAMYPQFCFYLGRPIESITIVEKEKTVVDLVMGSLKQTMDNAKLSFITVVEGTITNFLQETTEQFDTIYLDTWDNSDPRLLPSVNYLVGLADRRCAPGGQIQCWSYASMVETFVDFAETVVEKKIDLDLYILDPALENFFAWLKDQGDAPVSQQVVKDKAREIALSTAKPLEEYDIHRCFTLFARSYVEMHKNLARARKP